MQDRYTGDIGDFGKLGLLRKLGARLSIGVNWYLAPDETHNGDGRHTKYLEKDSFCACDDLLWNVLKQIVQSGERKVSALENADLLSAVYFSEEVPFSGATKVERKTSRKEWHQQALEALKGCDLVFVDPDNGLMVPSAQGGPKSVKFVLPEELEDYYKQGSSVVYYQHKARRADEFYMKQHQELLASGAFVGATGTGLKFIPTSQRYYFFIVQPKHKAIIDTCIEELLATPWNKCFVVAE